MKKLDSGNNSLFYFNCCFLTGILILCLQASLFSQQATNLDPAKSYVNVNIPATPESAAFAKYGNTEVDEFTGTAKVLIPLYTLKAQYLQVPITLGYSATGIKVNQEASWVGLGFDITAGGRITVETKGCSDFGSSFGLGSSNTATCMSQIFNRLGNHGENAVLTPASFFEPGFGGPSDPNVYNGLGISEMTQFGTGEPDIFHANFLDHSLTFYYDRVSGTLKWLGEQSDFTVNYTQDAFHNITGWSIVDDEGVTYFFNQTETTYNTLTGNAIVPNSSISAWLLTKIVHPTGEFVNFTYTNYGYTAPAFTMSGSIETVLGSTTIASDQDQNVTLQSPYYLTKIETPSVSVDFSLGTRTDLYGPGSRRLEQITIKDKIANIQKRVISFNYSYFLGTMDAGIHTYLGTLAYYLPSPLTTSGYLSTSNSRLRLDSVSLNANTLEPPFRFYYNSTVPDKYSYGQDHWGYYNGELNQSNGYGFSHLIPFGGVRGIQSFLPPAGSGFSNSYVGSNRDCVDGYVEAMMLDSVVYPTSGSTSFFYEPHQTTMTPAVPLTGCGVRVKLIKNYSQNKITGIKAYTYSLGRYMGTIHYFTSAYILANCSITSPFEQGYLRYSSNGAVNYSDITLGYGKVTITDMNSIGQSNGSVAKTFNIDVPSSNYANGGGYDIAPPYFFPGESQFDISGVWTYDKWLDPANKNLPPTPSANLAGKITQEAYYDSESTLKKSVDHYYHLANYTTDFYDVRAIQNRTNGFAGCSGGNQTGLSSGGLRPVNLFVSPAKSYRAIKDSVVERTYSGSSVINMKRTFQYNSFYQLMYETIYNSDGTQTINYTQTSQSLSPTYSLGPLGNALYLLSLKSAHIYSLPIEQTTIHRGTIGDSSVIASRLNIYDRSLMLKVYIAETAQPVTWRLQFIPAYYTYLNYPNSPGGSWDSLKYDTRYKLNTTADYSLGSQLRTIHSIQGNSTYLWDQDYNDMLAQCNNADSADVSFSSFETNTKGNWVYTGTPVADATSPTGGKCYLLSSGNISRSTLAGSAYIVSFWLKAGGTASLTGGTSTLVTGKTINGWTYREYSVTGASSITVSGSGYIDELRLYPSVSQMISYTFSPLIGLTSICDAVNRITYYFYDGIGRLKWIKDQDGNIVKTFQYHYPGLIGIQY